MDLPQHILTGTDRNSARCRRLAAYIAMLRDKNRADHQIRPYEWELKRRLDGGKPPGKEIKVPVA